MADLLQFPLLFSDAFEAPGPDETPEPTPEHTAEPVAPRPIGTGTSTLDLDDAGARNAALDIQRSWIVEAPAGSGKTGLLIQRLLKLLAFAEIERPNEILAITFTRKAANELRTRVLQQLRSAFHDEPLTAAAGQFERDTRSLASAVLARDRARDWRLLESPHQLNVRTIDAFCGDLAARVPLLSGGAGRRQPLDDASPLYEEAARRTIRGLGGPDHRVDEALRLVMLHRDGQIGDCVRLIADMLGNREQWGQLLSLTGEQDDANLDAEVRPKLERTLERVVCRALRRAAAAMPSGLLSELALFASRMALDAESRGGISPIAGCATRAQAPGTTADHLEHWGLLLNLLFTKENAWRSSVTKRELGFPPEKADKQYIEHLLRQLQAEEQRNPGLREALCALRSLPPASFPDDQWRIAKALFRVLRHALVELNILFQERGVTDFTEVALTARSLLGNEDAELAHTPGAQLTHLLVDEMQDTSIGQYDLLELLTRGWDGRTQTLFLVGDPKQSIYYFRQARVERFLRTQATGRLGDVPLGALRLTANFRSQHELVMQFNNTFGRILPSPAEVTADCASNNGEVPFVAATPTRPPGPQPAFIWHPRVAEDAPNSPDSDEDDDPTTPSAEDDARTIRQTIEQFLARPQKDVNTSHKPRVAVLARNRAHLAPIIEEFHRDHGAGPLPFRAVDIELLNERPEVLDLLALTRALLHPADRVAWLAVLRSPACGLSLADLLRLTGEGKDAEQDATIAHLVETRAHLLSAEGQQLLHRAWPVLAGAQRSIGHTSLSTHVERTWKSLGADAPLTPDQATNARRFLHLVHVLETGSEPFTIALLDRRLGKLYAEPNAGPVAAELMTIHKAKGLEWDLVIVPSLERGTGNSRRELLKWLEMDSDESDEAEIILAPIAGKGDDRSPLSRWLDRLQRTREIAEAKRLFYVACTRAREELHLFATCKIRQSGELAEPLPSSLLRAAWAAAEPVFFQHLTARRAPTPAAASATNVVQMPAPAAAPQTFAIAASADEASSIGAAAVPEHSRTTRAPQVQRLPLSFDPLQRLTPAAGPGLPYPPAGGLRNRAPFQRPQGSFAARAFGNVVHRFLELAAERLTTGLAPDHLLAELPQWRARVLNAFRAEGLPPGLSHREADRALDLVAATLEHPEGRWLLSPHAGARSERSLQVSLDGAAEAPRNLRADRVFLAGSDPLSTGLDTHLWIVDFKTAEPGGRRPEAFLAREREKYLPQMQAYAKASLAAAETPRPIVLALFYPALTQLLYWPFDPLMASQHIEKPTDTVRR